MIVGSLSGPQGFDLPALVLTAVLAGVLLFSQKVLRKKISPILLILLSAGLGVLIYGLAPLLA